MKTFSFKELHDKLSSEHNVNYYYRGQTQVYNGPLWPSMYRGTYMYPALDVYPTLETLEIPKELSLKKRGEYYVFHSNYFKCPENPTSNETKKLEEVFKNRQLKRDFMGHVRNALGYCLSEAMFQQAGWDSEGLDITDSLNIAFFFAMYKYNKEKHIYERYKPAKEPMVIYRWKLTETNWDFSQLNQSDYDNCPALFPSQKILDLFNSCCSNEEFMQSIDSYRRSINWNAGFFDLDSIAGNRPYHLIKIPQKWKSSSRIVNQRASLLFADSISLETVHNYYDIDNEYYKDISAMGGSFVEDLSKAHECEKYLFTISEDDYDSIKIDEDTLYNKFDFTHDILKDWMKSFYQNEWGTVFLPIPNGSGLAHLDFQLFQNDFSARFHNSEYLFNK